MIEIEEKPVVLSLKTNASSNLERIRRDMRFHPDKYFMSPKYKLFKRSGGEAGWDGYKYPLRFVGKTRTQAMTDRGNLGQVTTLCEKHDIPYRVKRLPRPFEGMTPDDLPDDLILSDFELDENQRIGITQWLVATMGMNRVTVSGGKTAMMCAAASAVKQNYDDARFMYITPTERLINQVYKEARQFLPSWDITKFGGGGKDEKGADMVVVTAAMVSKHLKRLVEEGWFKTFFGLLIDECHHCTANSWEAILRQCPALFRFAASDTQGAEDISKKTKMQGLVGEKLHDVSAAPLIQSGRIAKPYIYIVDVPEWHNKHKHVSHTALCRSTAWVLTDQWEKGIYLGQAYALDDEGEFVEDGKGGFVKKTGCHLVELGGEPQEVESRFCLLDRLYDKAIIKFKERNKLIADWTEYYAETKKLRTLVVCTRTLHTYILEALIASRLDCGEERVRLLLGEASIKERDRTFDWFRETEGAVLISPLVKEGVSINEIQAGVVADYSANWEFANQILGRFIRQKKEGANEAHITWFLDRQHPSYRKNAKELFRKLDKIQGYTMYYPCRKPGDMEGVTEFEARALT